MNNQVLSWLRASQKSDKLNILCSLTHESFESNLALTGHNFYSLKYHDLKDWNTYREVPKNYHIYNAENFPGHIQFDLVLTQTKFGQFQRLAPLAQYAGIPLISIEHTTSEHLNPQTVDQASKMRGHVNVFISEDQIPKWKMTDANNVVIRHCVDDSFVNSPYIKVEDRQNHILSIANDYIGRNVPLNFDLWKKLVQGLPFRVRGDTKGLSIACNNVEELISEYGNARIFLNTSRYSPIPSVLLEAAACLPEGEFIFFNYQCSKIEDIIRLQTLHENTKGDRIVKKHEIEYNDDLFSIKCNHIPVFRLTKHHPVAVVEVSEKYDGSLRLQGKKPYKKIISNISFKETKDLKINDWLVIPKPKEEKPLNLTKEWLRFYGLFVAEGYTSAGNITLTFNIKEKDFIKEIKQFGISLNRKVRIDKLSNEKAVRVSFTHAELAEQLRTMFGHLAHNKRIPNEFMTSSKEEISIFLEAYFDGDGYKTKKGGQQYSTTSPFLARQIFYLIMKLGHLPTFSTCKGKKGKIRGIEFQGKPINIVSFTPRHKNSSKLYLEDDNNFYVRINKITKIHYCGKVYNLSTESNTFTNPFALTHNCGCAIVTTETCAIPEYGFEHGVNCLMSNDPEDLRYCLEDLLKNPSLCALLGMNARRLIKEKYNTNRFVKDWNTLFDNLRLK